MKKLTRSSDKIFGGVLGGVANYFQIDPVWVRLGFFLFAFVVDFGTAVLFYIIALIIMPKSDYQVTEAKNNETEVIKDAFANRKLITLIGLFLILLGGIFLFEQLYHVNIWSHLHYYYGKFKDFAWAFLLIILGFWIVVRGSKK